MSSIVRQFSAPALDKCVAQAIALLCVFLLLALGISRIPKKTATCGCGGYGALATEQTYVGGTLKDTWQQAHDSAGRRILLTELNSPTTPFTFKYQADGNLVETDFNGRFYYFAYNSDGRLYWRGTPSHVQNLTRDLVGRIVEAAQVVNGTTVLDEKITWRGDSTQSADAITRGGSWSENRGYTYDIRGHLLSESFAPAAGISGSAAYQFDNSVAGGLGLRTMVTLGGGLSGSEAAAYSTFARLGSFSTSGKLTGALGTPVNQAFDATGEVTARQPGTGTDTMTWDALGRLVGVSRRSRGNSGFNWTAVYDGLGRRLQTSQQTVAGGTATGSAFTLKSSYDPDVEFMELVVTAGTQQYWLVHGLDINGRYGALQGTGGIEEVINFTIGPFGKTSYVVTGVVSDTYGHTEATVNSNNIVTWNTVTSNGYGAAPGSLAAVPMDAGHDLSAVLAWRGHYIDCTGYYYLGARYYTPDSGTFLSCDPLGHAASMSLYDYCNGDPVNGLDPDGRFGKGASYQEQMLSVQSADNYRASNGPAYASSFNGYAGEGWSAMSERQQISQVLNFVPVIGQFKAAGEAISGYDIAGGRYLSQSEQIGSAVNFAIGMTAVGGVGGAVERGAVRVETGMASSSLRMETQLAAETEGLAYRAINPQFAESTAQNGFFRSGAAGRLGNDGIYANTSMEGAIAEFSYHNPGITPAVFEVKYPLSPTLRIDPPSGYFSQPLPFTGGANILEAPSLRAPGSVNFLIRDGATPGLRLQ